MTILVVMKKVIEYLYKMAYIKKIGILDYKDISYNLVLVNGAYIKNEHEHPFTILSVMFEK